MGMLDELADEINRTATEHGFWDKERNFGEMMMLATSELAEALEEHRDGRPPIYYRTSFTSQAKWWHRLAAHFVKAPTFVDWLVEKGYCNRKPEGVAVELADCIIRCLDTMHSLGVSIDGVVRMKMEYNKSRPFKHGKAY